MTQGDPHHDAQGNPEGQETLEQGHGGPQRVIARLNTAACEGQVSVNCRVAASAAGARSRASALKPMAVKNGPAEGVITGRAPPPRSKARRSNNATRLPPMPGPWPSAEPQQSERECRYRPARNRRSRPRHRPGFDSGRTAQANRPDQPRADPLQEEPRAARHRQVPQAVK